MDLTDVLAVAVPTVALIGVVVTLITGIHAAQAARDNDREQVGRTVLMAAGLEKPTWRLSDIKDASPESATESPIDT